MKAAAVDAAVSPFVPSFFAAAAGSSVDTAAPTPSSNCSKSLSRRETTIPQGDVFHPEAWLPGERRLSIACSRESRQENIYGMYKETPGVSQGTANALNSQRQKRERRRRLGETERDRDRETHSERGREIPRAIDRDRETQRERGKDTQRGTETKRETVY